MAGALDMSLSNPLLEMPPGVRKELLRALAAVNGVVDVFGGAYGQVRRDMPNAADTISSEEVQRDPTE